MIELSSWEYWLGIRGYTLNNIGFNIKNNLYVFKEFYFYLGILRFKYSNWKLLISKSINQKPKSINIILFNKIMLFRDFDYRLMYF